MPAMVRNVTVKASNMFSRWMGAHMSDNQVDVTNTPNQIRIETVYYPYDPLFPFLPGSKLNDWNFNV